MPILEYACPAGHVTEVITVSAKTRTPTVPCVVCGEVASRTFAPSSPSPLRRTPSARESGLSQAIRRVQDRERR